MSTTDSGSTFGLVIVGVIVGMAILLGGEATHSPEIVAYSGGAIVLASVGLMTLVIARMEGGHDEDHETH